MLLPACCWISHTRDSFFTCYSGNYFDVLSKSMYSGLFTSVLIFYHVKEYSESIEKITNNISTWAFINCFNVFPFVQLVQDYTA